MFNWLTDNNLGRFFKVEILLLAKFNLFKDTKLVVVSNLSREFVAGEKFEIEFTAYRLVMNRFWR